MVFLKLLGFALSKLLDVFLKITAFIIKHWRVFLPLAIVVLGLWCIFTLKAQRDDSLKIYADHIAADKLAAEDRRQENVAKFLQASAKQAIADYQHQTEISLLRNQYDAQIKTYNAAAASSDNNWRERVRLEVARNAEAYGLPAIESSIQGSAEGGGGCDSAGIRQVYENLEIACAITTSDYNRLRSWADTTCEIYRCVD